MFYILIKKGIDLNMIKRRKVLSLFLASVMALGSVNTSYIAHANTINKVSEISSITFTNTIPLQSNRLYTIFIQLTVIDICIILYITCLINK